MKLSIPTFVCDQLRPVPPVETADLSGRTVMVVGANGGLGLEAAKHFARMTPGRLILACRNQAKGKAAMDSIEQATGFAKSELWSIDLSSFSTIVEFAEKFNKDGGRLDILVMNAGIFVMKYEATADGYESQLHVNHLGTTLLSLLLLPTLLKTGTESSIPARLVVVSSDMHYWTSISKKEQASPNILATMNSKEHCTSSVMSHRYQDTKLLNIFFARALTARLPLSAPVVVTNANPGFCKSDLRHGMPFPQSAVAGLAEKAIAFKTEEGSRQLVYGAIGGGENLNELRGAFVSAGCVKEVSDFVLSPEGGAVENRIWTETIDILAGVAPQVREIVDRDLSTGVIS
ncbi:hypothetical protein HWV62_37328 [Athelia sp. TMB]|nr:hypothetical protein HWV62_37328 [Athelia sp. TMB]